MFKCFSKGDVEDGSVSLQVPVSNGISNSASPHEVDNRSETASSGYASVQGADEPPLEEHVQSASKHHAENQSTPQIIHCGSYHLLHSSINTLQIFFYEQWNAVCTPTLTQYAYSNVPET